MYKRIIFITLLLLMANRLVFGQTLSINYLYELGVIFYEKGDYADAEHEIKKLLILEPNNAKAKELLLKIRQAKAQGKRPERPYVSSQMEEELDKMSRDVQMAKAMETLKMHPKAQDKISLESKGLKVTGETQLAFGIASVNSTDFYWRRANGNLNERNWRMLSDNALNQRHNTFDPRIYDRLRLNLDTQNTSGFNFHSNITLDPWSFTGKTTGIALRGTGGDYAEFQVKYWGNSNYSKDETVFTLISGDSFSLPEIKANEVKYSPATTVTSVFNNTFNIPQMQIKWTFQPIRELWLDYGDKEKISHFRFFPIAYADQALTSDDPLGLTNHHIYWEESQWLNRWRPGTLNTGATPDDFTKGVFDDDLAYETRDSDLVRLTALRGFSFNWHPQEETSLDITAASPKGLWQDYDSFDTFAGAARLKHNLLDNLRIGAVYTNRTGLNDLRRDSQNHVMAVDFNYQPQGNTQLALEAATSRNFTDRTSAYQTKSRGNTFYFSLVNTFPGRDLLGVNYNAINLGKDEPYIFKSRLFFSHMDDGFEPGLATYRESRDDAFWGRHLHFRPPADYYYSGLYYPHLTFDDIKVFRLGDSIDVGRDVVGLRLETIAFDERLEGLFDIRNAHYTNGKYIETVARAEATYKLTDKLTSKLLTLRHDLPKTINRQDPFLFNPDTNDFLINDQIREGEDPSLNTVSLGLEYKFWQALALSFIWEHTNDFAAATDNFPRGNLNTGNFATYNEAGHVFRQTSTSLYDQSLFPLPRYNYFDIFKVGFTIRPIEKLEIYLDYTRNEERNAGQIDDNINHIGLEVGFTPTKKWGMFFKYVYSRWNDIDRMRSGSGSEAYTGHHNFFSELRFRFSDDDELAAQFGEIGRSPVATVVYDPFGGSLVALDTQHIFRLYYKRKF